MVALLRSAFYSWNWGLERLNKLPKVTQLLSSRCRTWNPFCLIPGVGECYHPKDPAERLTSLLSLKPSPCMEMLPWWWCYAALNSLALLWQCLLLGWTDGWMRGWVVRWVHGWFCTSSWPLNLPEPCSDTLPYVPEFCAFLPQSVGYVDINGPLNPEAGRECHNHLVQHLTVQMGSPGSEKESDLSRFLSNLVAVSG